MPKLTFTLETISPLFLNGADPRNSPELRAASVRGQLRYWLRAILGARGLSLSDVWKEEEKIFGSTAMGSAVMVRLEKEIEKDKEKKTTTILSKSDIQSEESLPHRSKKIDKENYEYKGEKKDVVVRADSIQLSNLELQFYMRPYYEHFPKLLAQAISTWFLLGGLGKRSRRMFGAFDILGYDATDMRFEGNGEADWWGNEFSSVNHLEKIIKQNMLDIQQADHLTLPDFPILHKQYSRIVLCRDKEGQLFESPKNANQQLFNLVLRVSPFSHGYKNTFLGYVGFDKDTEKRRASPLHAQVRRVDDGYCIVLTYMASKLKKKDGNEVSDFKPVKEFFDKVSQQFTLTDIWGEAFK